MERKSRTVAVVVLMSVSALFSVFMAIGIPSVGTVTVTNRDGSVVGRDATMYWPWLMVWQVALVVTALLAMASIVAYVKRRYALTLQLLRVTAVIGLITTLIPGLLAFVAFQVTRNSPGDSQ
ncbi:hypothetical protein AB0M46_06215 [Dactylosporangium sp. NPDC051485]|uniref:hypothetical protein n=1 Tax=Dactylosporangium sp. NPDC051485 TaxID=3154846 RepID=UPI0034459B6A